MVSEIEVVRAKAALGDGSLWGGVGPRVRRPDPRRREPHRYMMTYYYG